jgi:hypothetical protein
MRFSILAITVAVLAVVAATAEAGSMTTFLTVAARYDNLIDANMLPISVSDDNIVAAGQPGIYQIDVSFTATKAAGEKGWGNTLFDVGIRPNLDGSDLALAFDLGWEENSGVVDTNGPSRAGIFPLYLANPEAGMAGDLQRIFTSILSPTIVSTEYDTRNNLGTPDAPAQAFNPPDPGSYIGSFFVYWNGQGKGTVTIKNEQFSFTTTSDTFGPVQLGDTRLTRVGFGGIVPVPEPASSILAGMALIGLVGFARGRN